MARVKRQAASWAAQQQSMEDVVLGRATGSLCKRHEAQGITKDRGDLQATIRR